MRLLDWAIVLIYLVWIVYDGLRRSKGTDKVEGYFLANRSLPWWAVGLSVMATQMSAVTLVGTTGQAYATGLRFVQLYLGLPHAVARQLPVPGGARPVARRDAVGAVRGHVCDSRVDAAGHGPGDLRADDR